MKKKKNSNPTLLKCIHNNFNYTLKNSFNRQTIKYHEILNIYANIYNLATFLWDWSITESTYSTLILCVSSGCHLLVECYINHLLNNCYLKLYF